MGMFTRLFGGKVGAVERSARLALAANVTAPSPGQPTFAEAVPGELMVTFYAHAHAQGIVGNFLTAASHGLVASGQRELTLTLRLGNREQPIPKMQEIVRFFTTVQSWAQAGSPVDEGGFTQFGERGLFGRPDCGLLYADALAMPGVDLPERALAAIWVDAGEIQAARESGIYRVLTRIGAQLRLFPFPTWGALDRPSVITPLESESLLTKVLRTRVRGASYVVAKHCLRLTIPSSATNLASGIGSLPSGASFVLLTRPATSANAILTWRPGQQGMSGISPDGSDGSRLSGSFVMFVPSTQGDQARIFEDGHSVLLSNESWPLLTAALVAQRPLALELGSGMRFELEWC